MEKLELALTEVLGSTAVGREIVIECRIDGRYRWLSIPVEIAVGLAQRVVETADDCDLGGVQVLNQRNPFTKRAETSSEFLSARPLATEALLACRFECVR